MSHPPLPLMSLDRMDCVRTHAGPGARARKDAGFLAHLLAARLGMPAARRLRRADPSDAVRAYRSAERPVGIGAALTDVLT